MDGDLSFHYTLAGGESTDEDWEFDFEKKYQQLFLNIELAIKKKLTKVKYFYSNNYRHYVTQYKLGDFYLFVGYRPTFNSTGDKLKQVGQYGVIYVTNFYSEFH